MDGAPAVRAPRFLETAEIALQSEDPRRVAEMIVAARKVLLETADKLLAAADRSELIAVLEQSLPEGLKALRVANLEVKYEDRREVIARTVRLRPQLLSRLQSRTGEDVGDRVRLGLLAADDESLLLGLLPGGLDAHEVLAAEDGKGRLLLMAIFKWAFSEDPAPVVWDALTFEFLDTAGRAYGLAATIVNNQLENVA